jgi:hypothetical protein
MSNNEGNLYENSNEIFDSCSLDWDAGTRAKQAIKQSGGMVSEIVLAPLGGADLHGRQVLPSWGLPTNA